MQIYVVSAFPNSVTLTDGTVVGNTPVAINASSYAYQQGIQNSKIVPFNATGLAVTAQGTLVATNTSVAVGTTYATPYLKTTGFRFAAIWPNTISGGTGNVNRRQAAWDGTLTGVDNASSGDPPSGFTRQATLLSSKNLSSIASIGRGPIMMPRTLQK